MIKLFARFTGRAVGAIGTRHEITETVEINPEVTKSFEDFRLLLYKKYEHISIDERDVFFQDTNTRYFYDRKRLDNGIFQLENR